MSKPGKQIIRGAGLGGVKSVVPLRRERGSLRADCTGTTLRDNLGIPVTGPAVSATVAPGGRLCRRTHPCGLHQFGSAAAQRVADGRIGAGTVRR
jgi:hypothetical protein